MDEPTAPQSSISGSVQSEQLSAGSSSSRTSLSGWDSTAGTVIQGGTTLLVQIGSIGFAYWNIDDAWKVLLEWKIGNWSPLPFSLLVLTVMATASPTAFSRIKDAAKDLLPFRRGGS
jgi:hypothetical protein